MGATSQCLAVGLGHLEPAAYYNHIDILAGTFQKQVTNISSHYITLQPQTVGSQGKQPELFAVKQPDQFLITV
jgi:hypothetical protein